MIQQTDIQEWVGALQGDNIDLRDKASAALVKQGALAVGVVYPLLSDPRGEVRAAAASVLGCIGPAAEAAADRLQVLTRDRDAMVRQSAAKALENVAPSYPVRARRRRLVRRLTLVACLVLLMAAAIAIGLPERVGGLLAGEPFYDGWPAHHWTTRIDDILHRDQVAVAVAELRAGGARAVPVLLHIARDKQAPFARREAIALLGRHDLQGTVPALIALLDDDDQAVRGSAAEALGQCGSNAEAATGPLYRLLNKPADPEREEYASALSAIGANVPPENIFGHFRYIEGEWHSLQFSDDGEQLMAFRGATIWSWNRTLPAGHSGYVSFKLRDEIRIAAFDPVRAQVLVADAEGQLSGRDLRLPDQKLFTAGELAASDKPIYARGTRAKMAYAPDGKTLALIRDRQAEVCDVAGEVVPWPRITLDPPPMGHVYSVIFSADGGTLAVEDDTLPEQAPPPCDGTWWAYDLTTRKLRNRIPAGYMTQCQAALSPDGKRMAINSDTASRRILIWDVDNGTQGPPLTFEGWGVTSMAFTGANHLAVGTANGKLAMWDLTGAKQVRDLPWHHDEIDVLAVSPDGATLASADGKGWVRLWAIQPAERE